MKLFNPITRGLPAVSLAVMTTTAQAVGKGGVPINEPVSGGYSQVFFGLLLIVAIILGAAWFMRRYGNLQSSAGGAMRVLAGMPLGPRERVILVQVGDTQLLLGIAPGRVQTLHVLDKPLTIQSGHTRAASDNFAERLNSLLRPGKSS